jgi:cytochrome c-type biogenesis protein CcmH
MFITVIALISLVVVIWVVWPLIRAKKDVSPDLQSVNSKLLETQISELDADLEQGVIEQSQHDAARLDLQRTFLETATESDIQPSQHAKADPLLIALIAVVLPISSYVIYKQVGTDPATIKYMADQPSGGQAGGPHGGAAGDDINAMLAAVREKAEANPDDLDSWAMLAQTLHIMKDMNGAEKAYLHLINKGVEEAEIYANYADVLASQEGGILITSPAFDWAKKALLLEPNHQQALWIAGTAAYYSKDYVLAKQFWEHLLSLLEPDSNPYNVISQNLEQMAHEASAK